MIQEDKGKDGRLVRFEMRNGMRIVLKEVRSAPAVAFNVWVRVGSGDEEDKEAGIAHVFEHMLFKGTQRRGVGEIAKEVESDGGDINAYTSLDQTVYFIVIASRYFDTGLDILADAVQNSAFDPKELERESEVVLEELKRSTDNPASELDKALFETAFRVHNYRRPVIGYDETVKSFTRDQILDFFRRWYVANNVTFVAVGDFDASEARPKIEAAFKDFKPRPDLDARRRQEPPQEELRVEVIERPSGKARLEMGFHIPSIVHEDVPPLDLLAIMLGQGESSRLYREIKEEKGLVHGIYTYSYTPKDPGLFFVGSMLDPGKVEAALEAILGVLYEMREGRIPNEELEKAKTNIESDTIYDRETVQGLARKLGFYESIVNDLEFEAKYLEAIRSATIEDIARVARKYLTPENLTVALLWPKGLAAENGRPDEASLRSVVERVSAARSEVARKHTLERHRGDIWTAKLENGLRLVIKENTAVPTIAVRVAMLGGLLTEPEGKSGIANFTASMLTRGTESRSARALAEEIDGLAASLDGFSGRSSLGATLDVLAKHFDKGLDLLGDVLLHPALEEEEIDKERSDILAAIARREDNLARFAFEAFAEQLYERHPYRRPRIGTEETIRGIKREDLLRYLEKHRTPENMVVSVVGDVKAEAVLKKIDALFGSLPRASFDLGVPVNEDPITKPRAVTLHRKREQAHLVLGFHGTTVNHDDRFPLEVLSTVLSGQGGRLFLELRDKKSLAYSVTSMSFEGYDPGYFAVYMGTSPEKVEVAMEGIRRELKKAVTEPPSAAELERAKKYIIGTYEIDLQRNSSQATALAFDLLYGIGVEGYFEYPEKIEAVTAEGVLAVAKKYIDLDRYALVVVRPGGPEENGSEQERSP